MSMSIPQVGNFEATSLPQLTTEPRVDEAGRYAATDTDGICYVGSSELDCYRQMASAQMEQRIAAELGTGSGPFRPQPGEHAAYLLSGGLSSEAVALQARQYVEGILLALTGERVVGQHEPAARYAGYCGVERGAWDEPKNYSLEGEM